VPLKALVPLKAQIARVSGRGRGCQLRAVSKRQVAVGVIIIDRGVGNPDVYPREPAPRQVYRNDYIARVPCGYRDIRCGGRMLDVAHRK
jgi:hypothetical protein